MINTQRLLCTVIKFHVVEETKEAREAVLYFAQELWSRMTITARYRSNLRIIER